MNVHDVYRLDTIAMRFEATFTRVKNALINYNNEQVRLEISTQNSADPDAPHHKIERSRAMLW
ncbi:hypothetical protein [Roseobacter sp.]|uniref:hypothetical protein n=1 Tax=Roseobacter sp. TaxID=1907202 RepID=UPI00329858E1